MRLLVQTQLLRTGERLDAGEYRVVRLLQPLRRLFRRDAHAGRREALHEIGHDRIGELVHFLAIEPVSEHAGAALKKSNYGIPHRADPLAGLAHQARHMPR